LPQLSRNFLAMPLAKQSQNESQPPGPVLAGRTLRMIRNTHGVGLRQVAKMVGISASHLSRVESGERPATPDLMNRICDALATLPVPEDVA
jgi:DNA-binding Xre family transcriptional regulator